MVETASEMEISNLKPAGARPVTQPYTAYTDSPTVRAVALAPSGSTLTTIPSEEQLDFTSRVRTAELGRYVVLQNRHGFYAALEILEIRDDTRGDKEDLLRFRYWIQSDGTCRFNEEAEA